MPEPAFIVEGHMEKKIVQRICSGKPVRMIGCNGDDVTMEVMAKFIATQIRTLPRNYPIFVIFDRERCTQNVTELKINLHHWLEAYDIERDDIFITIADRTTENWILCDDILLKKRFGARDVPQNPEGVFGKSFLKKIIRKTDVYGETTLGVDLFLSMDTKSCYLKSASFRELIDSINIDC